MTRVLVTGGTGFIGSALVPRMVQAGYVPRLLVRHSSAPVPPPPVASRRLRVATRALLTIALVVIAVSIVRKIGSQYFARRAWHAFETQDFARARREYDRTLLFGRGYASSADAMFWRASSMFRMDDCAAAVPAYEELITRAPETVWAAESQYQIGICLARLGQHGSAAAAFQRTVERYEHNRWSDAAADRLREIHGSPATGTR
jgi:tetratricopeptide (TPR) repeat protein